MVGEDGPHPDDLVRLRRDAEDIARRMADAQNPDLRFDGRDPAGAVTVTVDGAGQVHDVTVGRSWQRQIAAGDVAAAVKSAVDAALLARLEHLDRALDEQLHAPAPQPAASSPAPGSPAAGPAAPGSQEFGGPTQQLAESLSSHASDEATLDALRQVLHMLADLDTGLDELAEQIDTQVNRPYTGHSGGRHVAVSVTAAGGVVGIDIDIRWLAGADEDTIGREIRQAFQAGHQLAGQHSAQQLVADSAIGRMGRLAADPVELARRLGLAPKR